MSSGQKKIILNSNERAVSTDFNRLQQFAGADMSEFWRAIADSFAGTDDLTGGAQVPLAQFATQNTPNTAEIFGGLGVKPAIGTLVLLVDPGSIMMIDPDSPADPSDSPYKFIRDPGVPLSGALSMTSNSSGSTRIDVIECARLAPDSVLETDNRDIFDPISGLFTASTVNKVSASQLQYRVRLGTPGAGFPGNALGWVPLAVASVPTGTTTNDTITFWDVRPMVSDRAYAPWHINRDFPQFRQNYFVVDNNTNTGKAEINGILDVVSPLGRRLGGRLRTTAPASGATFDGMNLRDPANQDGAGLSGSGLYYVYAFEPFSLPRWVRYTNAADGVRRPFGPRGLIVASTISPNHFYGTPSAGLQLPTAYGMGTGASQNGVCFAVGRLTGGVPQAIVCDGRVQNQGKVGSTLVNATSITSAAAFFTLVDGTTHPANAKALWVNFVATFNVTGGHLTTVGGGEDVLVFPGVQVTLNNPLAVVSAAPNWYFSGASNETGMTSSGLARIPISSAYPTLIGPNKTVAWNPQIFDLFSSAAITPTACTMDVLGWEI